MQKFGWMVALMAMTALSGCAVAVGGAAVVIADEVIEDRDGGDGLF